MQSYTERVPFSFVEKKEAALVWHFRQSPEAFADAQAKRLDEELKVGLANQAAVVQMGHKIVEAKAMECNKGTFLRWLMQLSPTDKSFYLCLGDDITDEDMFTTVGTRGSSVKIGTGNTAAEYRLESQQQVLPFLIELQNLLQHFTYQERGTHA